jgi:hypothetical protein
MNNLFINCNNCGSSLQIDEDVIFTTCRNCSTSLEIIRTVNSIFTKPVNYQIIAELEPLENQNVISDLDFKLINQQLIELENQWEDNLHRYEYSGLIPNFNKVNGFVLLFLTLLCFGLPIFLFLFNVYVALIAVLFMLFLLVIIIKEIHRATSYTKAKKGYEKKRINLLDQLN